MASHGGDGGGGGGGPRKFFKVLLPGSFEISLSLPPKFAAGLGGARCPWRTAAAAKLRDRAGRSWDVDLRRDRDAAGHHRAWFTGRGWRGFVSAHAVSAGQLLVFDHRGGLDFAVDLFDASGCCCDRDDGNGGREVGGFTEVVEEPPPQQQQQQHILLMAAEPATADKESVNSRRRAWPEDRALLAAPSCTGGGVKRRRTSSPSTGATTVVSGGDVDNETLCRRIERPYQLQVLDLSKSFCERVGWSSSRDVVLCADAAAGDGDGGGGGGEKAEDKKRWQVSVKVSGKSGMICRGWTEFAQDNGLAISDVCVFSPLHGHGSDDDVLQVRLLRGGGRGAPAAVHLSSNPEPTSIERLVTY